MDELGVVARFEGGGDLGGEGVGVVGDFREMVMACWPAGPMRMEAGAGERQ